MKFKLLIVVLLSTFTALQSSAQTPGAIVAEGGQSTPAITPLNPNGDGFITSTGSGFSAGQEASEFEIPWRALVLGTPEPVADIQTGAVCGQTEIVSSVPTNNAYAGYFYMDDRGTPALGDDIILFRIRVASLSSGNFGFSFLFDTDLTIGNTAPNNDPNFIAGNPGFEREVNVVGSGTTGNNNQVRVLNVDGNTGGNNATQIAAYSKTTHWQRSYAQFTDSSCTPEPAVFVDFYVPMTDLGLTIDSNFRVVFATASSGGSALSGSASDIGGIDDNTCGSDDDCFTTVVNETPIADIAVDKTLVTPPTYVVGQTLEYSITVSNAGPDIATNIDVTDTPTNLTITSVTGGGCTSLPCTIPSIGVGGSVVLTVQATTNALGSFDNTVTVRTATAERNLTNNTDNTGNGGTVIVPTFVQVIDGPWDDASNWNDLRVPTVNDDAAIDTDIASYLTQNQAVNNLELRSGSTVSIPSSTNTLTVVGNIQNDGDFTLYNVNQNASDINAPIGTNGNPNVDGEVLLNGSATQTLSGTGNYYNLRVNNSNGVDVDNAVTTDPTEINGILTVDNGIFTTNDNVLFPCFFEQLNIGDFSNGRAGQIGPIGAGGSISGDVRVEQCYPGRRAYRYVTSSVTTENSIHDNWQEGATAYNDQLNETELEQEDVSPLINDIPYLFGTHITGLGEIPGSGHTTTPAGGDQVQGLDWQASGNPSMFEFNETGANAQTFTPVLATEPNTLVAGKAYSMIIRGSRKVNLLTNASPTYNTKLRSTGQPVKGDYTFIPTVNDEQFLFVGNPFHSIVDMRRVVYGSDLDPSTPGDNSAGINRYMYIFDPTLGNSNVSNPTSTLEGNRGAFVVIDLQGQFVPSNGEGGTGGTSLSSMGPYLQAYQGFFIQATANTQSLVFSETDKAVRQNQVNVFSTTPTDMVSLRLFDQVSYANNGTSKDYLAIKFGQNENSGVDYDDALKFTNHDENIGRLESNSYLTYENREMPQIGEVLELYTFNYRTTDYTFVVKVDGLLDKTVSLYDNYLNTDTVLNNDMSTAISFTVDPANPASTDPYRFELRFETSTLGNNEFDLQGISVYPNPASDILNINLGENTGRFESLELYDISGRLIATKNLNNNVLDVQMNVNGYSSGIYVLKVSSGAEQFSTKVIIE